MFLGMVSNSVDIVLFYFRWLWTSVAQKLGLKFDIVKLIKITHHSRINLELRGLHVILLAPDSSIRNSEVKSNKRKINSKTNEYESAFAPHYDFVSLLL